MLGNTTLYRYIIYKPTDILEVVLMFKDVIILKLGLKNARHYYKIECCPRYLFTSKYRVLLTQKGNSVLLHYVSYLY